MVTLLTPSRTVGRSRRSAYQQPRPSKMTPDQMEVIRRSRGRSLRDLAADFGVSHETIRTVLHADTADPIR